jgi:hypothetical protein
VPSIAVMPRQGSFALAFFGRVRKVQASAFALLVGRKSFALQRILEALLVILPGISLFFRSSCLGTLPNSYCRATSAFGVVQVTQLHSKAKTGAVLTFDTGDARLGTGPLVQDSLWSFILACVGATELETVLWDFRE